MLKQITVCFCDICGASEPAKPTFTCRNEHVYDLPDGWVTAWGNKHVHICPECNKKLRAGYKEGRA